MLTYDLMTTNVQKLARYLLLMLCTDVRNMIVLHLEAQLYFEGFDVFMDYGITGLNFNSHDTSVVLVKFVSLHRSLVALLQLYCLVNSTVKHIQP